VSDPNQVVSVGQRVKVRVLSVDLARNRIALTLKRSGTGDARPRDAGRGAAPSRSGGGRQKAAGPAPVTVPKPGTVAPNGMRFK
jgi:uncharacterized protein